MAEETEQMTSGKELKAGVHKVVRCRSGHRYRIQRLTGKEWLGAIGALPDVSAIPTTEEEQQRLAERIAAKRMPVAEDMEKGERLVALALIDPKVGTGEGEIEIRDIPPDDLGELAAAVIAHFGMNRKEALKVRPLSETAAC